MRKVLLTTAAVLGAAMGLAGVANAQALYPSPPPGVSGPTAGTIHSTPQPVGSIGITQGMQAPNSFVVHLNGRINWYAGVEGSSANQVDGNKMDPFSFQGYIRLYPGFNATAANGLKYGVVAEIRNPGSGYFTGPGPSGNSARNTLFWRRAYGYVGTDELGTLRFGQGDGPMTIFQVGTFEGFNDGAWNGDAPGFAPGVTFPVFPFTDVGNLYTSNKLVYLSPDFSGFHFGVGFEPNTSVLVNTPSCDVASAVCNATAATDLPINRRRNTIDVGGEYTGTFSGVGIDIGASYIASEHVSNPGPKLFGLSYAQMGATLSYAGFSVGGNVNWGMQNGDYSTLLMDGQRHQFAWLVGGQYETGPVVVGASYFQTQFAGNSDPADPFSTVARTENDVGVAAGATYQLVPGMELFASYLYGERHQAGWDFNAGAPGPGGNNTHVNVFALGTQLTW